MYAGFLTGVHDSFQFIIFIDAQGYGYFIQTVHGKNLFQVGDGAHDPNPLVLRPPLRMVVQNPPDQVPPVRIGRHPVNVALRRPAVTDEQHVLLIVPLPAKGAQHAPQRQAEARFQDEVKQNEQEGHLAGEMNQPVLPQVQHQGDEHGPHHVGPHDVEKLQPPSHDPHGLVQMEKPV